MSGLIRYFITILLVCSLTIVFGSGCSKKKKKPFFFPPETGTGTGSSTGTSTGTDTGTSTGTGSGTGSGTGTSSGTGSGTGSATGTPPGMATNPGPSYGATGVSTNINCTWNAVADADSYDVYFSSGSPPSFLGNQPGNIFNPGALATDTTYFWRIDSVNAFGTTTGNEWSFVTGSAPSPPAQASNPDPADGAQDITLGQQLSWASATGADYYDIYFSTSPSPTFVGCQAGTSYDPGLLVIDTSYYWRIDTVNANGTTTGFVWSFHTGEQPGVAGTPVPADTATDILMTQTLDWAAVADANTYHVYFGTVSPGADQGQQAGTGFDPGLLTEDTSYYWRIDTINEFGTTTGAVWSFRTGAAPAQAGTPSPADTATDILLTQTLDWAAVADANTYHVYFGTVSPGADQGQQAGTGFDPGLLTEDTSYYWRIDTINEFGTTTGAVWSFRTGGPPAQATNPVPADAAIDILLTQTLSWNLVADATTYTVYFGNSNSPIPLIGDQAGIVYDPGVLIADTSYYWRIDTMNDFGNTTGVEWSFRTGAPPAEVSGLSPGNGSTVIYTEKTLTWNPSPTAAGYYVFFSDTAPPSYVADVLTTDYDPGILTDETTYYWKIVAYNIYGNATASTWNFNVSVPAKLDLANAAGGTTNEEGSDIATLQDGSFVVTGYFFGNSTFGAGEPGETTITSAGQSDIFIAKYDNNGLLSWATSAGGAEADVGSGIAILDNGTIFITGHYSISATFGAGQANETILTADSSSMDIFIARYNGNGTLNWAKSAGGSKVDSALDIAVFSDGSCVITGEFYSTPAVFDAGGANETSLSSVKFNDIFIARYNPDGSLNWALRAGGDSLESGRGICTIPDGSIFVTGSIKNKNAYFDNSTFIVASGGKPDTFLAKYNGDGTLAWVRNDGSGGGEEGYSVAALPDGTAVVTGYFSSSAVFGSGEANESTLVSEGGEDIFIAKYTPSGTLLWATGAGGAGDDTGRGVAIHSDGSVYATGLFLSPAIFGAGHPNQTDYTIAGDSDIFIARYGPDGLISWAKRGGDPGDDRGLGISVLSDGSATVTGSFTGTVTFGPGEAKQTTLSAAGGASDIDVFIARFLP